MDPIARIKDILENQNEVKYLQYFLVEDERSGEVILKISTVDGEKTLKYKDKSACLDKIVDVLFDLKKKESYCLLRIEREKNKYKK